MNHHKLLGCLVLGSMMLLSSAAFAEVLKIKSVTANGSGCPTGSASTLVMDTNYDGKADFFQVSYAEFVAERPGTATKNCMITVQVEVPRGIQFSILTVESKGYADISEVHKGVFTTSYDFAFAGGTQRTQGTLTGPYAGEFGKLDRFPAPSWSPCNQNFPLNINNRIAIQKNPSVTYENGYYSVMQVDRTSGMFTQLFAITWQPCH